MCIAEEYNVQISTVVGFPTGAHSTDVKIVEAHTARTMGATEFDVVWNLGMFKSGKKLPVMFELQRIVKAVEPYHVKVIVEEYYLDAVEKKIAWEIVRDSGAWAIKTSTGFGASGATTETVRQWKALGDDLKIKAAGGISTLFRAKDFILAGADIIGTSHGIAIVAAKRC